jgi:hypothetical protein
MLGVSLLSKVQRVLPVPPAPDFSGDLLKYIGKPGQTHQKGLR